MIDPGYVEEYAGMDSRYQVSICKLYADKSKKALDGVSFYVGDRDVKADDNLKRPQTIFVVVDPEIYRSFQQLRTQINRFTTGKEQEDAIQVIDAMEGQYKSGAPSKLKVLPTVGTVSLVYRINS